MKIQIQGLDQLTRMASNISRNTTAATRIAINTSIRWGRTRIREDISQEYNVKLGRLYASDRKKGLNTKLATTGKLEGEITAGHQPISLHQFNGTKASSERTSVSRFGKGGTRTTIRRAAGISVEVKKGKRQTINSAFFVRKKTNVVFARGRYNPKGFVFRKRRETTGMDMPITGLNTTSVATMALTKRVFNRWQGPIQRKYEEELKRQLKRLL